jgi:hypothetical protein
MHASMKMVFGFLPKKKDEEEGCSLFRYYDHPASETDNFTVLYLISNDSPLS